MRRAIKHLHVIQNDFLCVTEGVLLSMLMNGIMRPRGCFNFPLFYNINIVHISKGTLIIINLFATLRGSTV